MTRSVSSRTSVRSSARVSSSSGMRSAVSAVRSWCEALAEKCRSRSSIRASCSVLALSRSATASISGSPECPARTSKSPAPRRADAWASSSSGRLRRRDRTTAITTDRPAAPSPARPMTPSTRRILASVAPAGASRRTTRPVSVSASATRSSWCPCAGPESRVGAPVVSMRSTRVPGSTSLVVGFARPASTSRAMVSASCWRRRSASSRTRRAATTASGRPKARMTTRTVPRIEISSRRCISRPRTGSRPRGPS